jgi:hypothetical protein
LKPACLALVLALLPSPALARESLGIFGSWGAFRDKDRCHAIAMAEPSTMRRDFEPTASIGTWPRQAVRNQLHIRLSRRTAPDTRITLILGAERFALTGGSGNAWAADKRMDAAITAAMRSAGKMIVSATDDRGNRFSNTYDLAGVATAMDAATMGCARVR